MSYLFLASTCLKSFSNSGEASRICEHSKLASDTFSDDVGASLVIDKQEYQTVNILKLGKRRI